MPNLMTLGNLFSGIAAIVRTSEGDLRGAVFFFVAALIFDMIDGMAARLIGATSDLGAELDSLCDVVSFGVFPAFLLYTVHFNQYGNIGILIASAPALMGALRLARFNVLLDSFEDKTHFRGLPIPASAMTLVSYIFFIYKKDLLFVQYCDTVIVVLTVVVSLLMVSNVRFDNMPRPTAADFKTRPVFSILFFIALFASIWTKGTAIFVCMMLYIIYSTIRYLIYVIRNVPSVENEIDDE